MPRITRAISIFCSLATLAALVFLLWLREFALTSQWIHNAIENVGLALMIACVIGRTWSSSYLSSDSGTRLVTKGPYSVCRHPDCSFVILGALGAAMQTKSVLLGSAMLALTAVVVVHRARKEEKALADEFGDAYCIYAMKVRRFLPTPRSWQDVEKLRVVVRPVHSVFLRTSLLLLMFPLGEFVEHFLGAG